MAAVIDFVCLNISTQKNGGATGADGGWSNASGLLRMRTNRKENGKVNERSESFREPATQSSGSLLLLRNHLLHKSLPDLNSPKLGKKSGRGGCYGGRMRSASTDLDSCSDCSGTGSSVRMSGSSASSAASGGESSLESEAHFQRTSRPRSSAGIERQTTSDYASRSPSFKYETSSLVQVPP